MNTEEQKYELITAALQRNNILASAAEIQGVLCGMLGGGMPLEAQDWVEAIADFVNQGEPLAKEVQEQLVNLYNLTCQQLVESDFSLVLCLPDDAAPINERGQALLEWVQGFMLGFGLFQDDLTKCSPDVKEALEDFAEIARMDEEMAEGEEFEQALFEVVEYVRVSAMLCFNELGKSPEEQQSQPKTVH
ncbi:MAG: UPF0149 family protein [Paraglaciecola chathamensis]|uniref:UPF0149 family protein n=1 Tax=Paraglaciecola chathamensis TaxID=368405 RepID=A0ABS0W956_9ALTE|nr:UPF0149 family protein [Paraglaciecola chathamensis]MBJ2135301.1 UPF0149 family protein [Paraglaciecola chathamensis]